MYLLGINSNIEEIVKEEEESKVEGDEARIY